MGRGGRGNRSGKCRERYVKNVFIKGRHKGFPPSISLPPPHFFLISLWFLWTLSTMFTLAGPLYTAHKPWPGSARLWPNISVVAGPQRTAALAPRPLTPGRPDAGLLWPGGSAPAGPTTLHLNEHWLGPGSNAPSH